MLGAGQLGKVYKAINLDEGKLVAVKIMEQPPGSVHRQGWVQLNEVEILFSINHVSEAPS